MKRFSILLVLLALSLSLVGCGNGIIRVEIGEDAETAVAGAVISGAMIYEDAKDVVSNATESLDAMVIDTTNAMLKPYEGEGVKGATVSMLLKQVESLNENEMFPITLSVEYKDRLSQESISVEDYYSVEILDTLPTESVDGFYDLIVISEAEVVSISGE